MRSPGVSTRLDDEPCPENFSIGPDKKPLGHYMKKNAAGVWQCQYCDEERSPNGFRSQSILEGAAEEAADHS